MVEPVGPEGDAEAEEEDWLAVHQPPVEQAHHHPDSTGLFGYRISGSFYTMTSGYNGLAHISGQSLLFVVNTDP